MASSKTPTSTAPVKETLSCNWTIENFTSKFSQPIKGEQAPVINLRKSGASVLFRLYPKVSKDLVLIDMSYRCKEKPEQSLKYRISILDSTGAKQRTKEFFWKNWQTDEQIRSCSLILSHEFMDKKSLDGLLVDGSLKLLCEVDVLDTLPNETEIVKNATLQPQTQTNSKPLKSAETLSDFTIVVRGKEFAVHKNILAARSPVFAQMFKNKMKEVVESRLELTDVKLEVFEQLLRFIYQGKEPNMDKFVVDLYKMADKYQLEDLKYQCELFLYQNVTVESVANTLLLADMHNCGELKDMCVSFFKRNIPAVVSTAGYKDLLETRVELVTELLQTFAAGSRN